MFKFLPYCHELEKFKCYLRVNFQIDLVFNFTIEKYLIKKSDAGDRGGVYIVPCNSCELSYVGETLKTLNTRLQQHKYYFRTACLKSAIYRHFLDHDHVVHWEESRFTFTGI